MDQNQRELFILARMDTLRESQMWVGGSIKGCTEEFEQQMTERYFSDKHTVRQLLQKITSLYHDPKNLDIPIGFIQMIANKALDGAPATEVERILAQTREGLAASK